MQSTARLFLGWGLALLLLFLPLAVGARTPGSADSPTLLASTTPDPGNCPGPVTLPFVLTFDGGDGGLVDSGFQCVQGTTHGQGFLPERLALTDGVLRVTTTDGDNWLSGPLDNNQDNALQVMFNAGEPFTITARLRGPLLLEGNWQNGGIFFGPDEDNFVKLVVLYSNLRTLQFGVEEGGNTEHDEMRTDSRLLTASSVDLILQGFPISRQVRASYRIDGGPANAAGTFTLNEAHRPFFVLQGYAGLQTTDHGPAPSTQFLYDTFRVDGRGQPPTPTPTITPSPTLTPTPTPTPTPIPRLDLASAEPIACDQQVASDTRGAAGHVNWYSCVPWWSESGPEHIYAVTLAENTDLDTVLGSMDVDLDLFLVTGESPTSCIAYGDNAISAASLAPGTYYLVVDGYEGAAGAYELSVWCPLEPSPTPTATVTPTATASPPLIYLPVLIVG